jgi:hypothetical protein
MAVGAGVGSDSTLPRAFVVSSAFSQLLEEKRHAVLDRGGGLGGLKAFGHLFAAALDQEVTILGQELVEHSGKVTESNSALCAAPYT